MNFLDKQINEANDNYNYFFTKLIFCILKITFKLLIVLLLSSIFNYIFINIIAILFTIYYFYNIIKVSKYYIDIIRDIQETLGYTKLCFEIDLNLLHINLFRGVVRYGK